MNENLDILSGNLPFLAEAYNLQAYSGLFGLLIVLGLVDLVLKGFAMWRAARLKSVGWFAALLVINSAGIVPAIYLLMTRDAYAKSQKGITSAPPPATPGRGTPSSF